MRLPRLPLFHLSTLNYYALERKLLVVCFVTLLLSSSLLHHYYCYLHYYYHIKKLLSNYRRTGHFLCNEPT